MQNSWKNKKPWAFYTIIKSCIYNSKYRWVAPLLNQPLYSSNFHFNRPSQKRDNCNKNVTVSYHQVESEKIVSARAYIAHFSLLHVKQNCAERVNVHQIRCNCACNANIAITIITYSLKGARWLILNWVLRKPSTWLCKLYLREGCAAAANKTAACIISPWSLFTCTGCARPIHF